MLFPKSVKTNKSARYLGIIILSLFLVVGSLGVYRLITGRSLGLRSLITDLPHSVASIIRSIVDHAAISSNSHGEYTNIIFLHHSVGAGIIVQGDLRDKLSQAGFAFYDHNYNDPGLTYPNGQLAGYHYRVPDDNTDIDGLVKIFQQPLYSLPVNTLSALFQHEVIIVKSCFPNNHITSDEQLVLDQSEYKEIREVMRQHPEKLFIFLTSPPLNPAETNIDEAARARELANWLGSDQFIGGQKNIFVFDLFDILAEKDPNSPEVNQLRAIYREGSDSHPNQAANEIIGGMLAEFVEGSVKDYRTKSTND